MSNHWRRWLIPIACLLLAPTWPVAARAAPSLTLRLPPTTVAYATDGAYVVWSQRDPPALYAAAFADGRQMTIAQFIDPHLNLPQPSFWVGSDLVLWIEPNVDGTAQEALMAHDFRTGARSEVTRERLKSPVVVDIRGDHVVWTDWPWNDRQHWVRNVRDGTPATPILPREVADLGSALGQVRWSERYTVWEEVVAQNGQPAGRLHWLIDGRFHTIAAPVASSAHWMKILGDTLYLSYYRPGRITLWALDLNHGRLWQILDQQAASQVISADERYLAWWVPAQYWRALVAYDTVTDGGFGFHVLALDLATEGAALPPTLGSGHLVLTRRGQPDAPGWLLEALPVVELTPAGRRNVVPNGPHHFTETGHNLGIPLADFWKEAGGLPVFGYPLTEQFTQRRAGSTEFALVQWFERQRFEYQPAKAGTPYEVELGRLGAEDADRRADVRGLWAFNPIADEATQPAGCRYLADVSHRLCGEFRPYWENHGLEFGDPDVSFRESLALFGYPISEEFIDPATGRITQYFERAVFEYHANLPVGQRVLLRRLGAEYLARVGWGPG